MMEVREDLCVLQRSDYELNRSNIDEMTENDALSHSSDGHEDIPL
jgi:hypothetical protein